MRIAMTIVRSTIHCFYRNLIKLTLAVHEEQGNFVWMIVRNQKSATSQFKTNSPCYSFKSVLLRTRGKSVFS